MAPPGVYNERMTKTHKPRGSHNNSGAGPEDSLMRVPEAARFLSISPRSLWALTKSGQIAHVRIGTSVRYRRQDLDAFITSAVVKSRKAS